MKQDQLRKVLEGWEAYMSIQKRGGYSDLMMEVMNKHRSRMLKALLQAQLQEFLK